MGYAPPEIQRMLESIYEKARGSNYDFRTTANPADPLSHLFEEWVPYYRTKWAVACVLKPSSILEIGVRYGYSAAAFLHGFSDAKYLGIDMDTDTFGGAKGAIDWAKKITANYSVEYVIADTQKMSRLPGLIYDMIHVDGQQDGDGTYHDMELAVRQGRYVLADGYLWTRTNFLAINEFLYQNRDLIELYGVIPGYAGELLIKVNRESLERTPERDRGNSASSSEIRQAYTSGYYLNDCGGYDSFKQSGGKELRDPRLVSLAAIASLKQHARVLDLGCGRGELSYWLAEQGCQVTAIDYSPDAIELAGKCFAGREELRKRVELVCGDVCTISLSGKYDLAIASDVIEHLSPAELEKLYARVAKHLEKDGLFVVHTFPNRWYYQYEYVRKRKAAAALGTFLSPQPRTRYELLMHINEQSPPILKRTLRRHFKSVISWFADDQKDIAGSLARRFSIQDMRSAPDLFAVASHSLVVPQDILARLRMEPLQPLAQSQLLLTVKQAPKQVIINNNFDVLVEIRNGSRFFLGSMPPHPVNIAYHWMDARGTKVVLFDGVRSMLWPPLGPGSSRVCKADVVAPETPGQYVLRLTMVQELVRWFDEPPTSLVANIAVVVQPGLPGASSPAFLRSPDLTIK